MRRFGLLFALLLSACSAFPPFGATHVDYFDLVRWNGIDYMASFAQVGRAITDADLGPEYFRVKQTLATAGRGAYYQVQDGDAAFVPTGNPVFTLRGYAPTFRLAAHHDGRLVLYEAHINPAARTGRDLLDIEGKVVAIALLDQKRATKVLARIAEPPRVEALIRLVLDGRVGGAQPPTETSAQRRAPDFVMLAFELKDGTASVRGYDLVSSSMPPNLAIAGSFRDAILALRASAPTPTPAPALVNLARRYDLARAQSVTVKRPDRQGPQQALSVAEWSAALDADMPATRSDARATDEIVVIFSFADHYVSLVYDRESERFQVAVPDDELAVRATDAFKALLSR